MKIDYEITVDVSKADIETKKRVQDAFFKLGIMWVDGRKHGRLNAVAYTNTAHNGGAQPYLMWSHVYCEPTHTVDELLELVGMKTKTDLIPFDLEKALAGDPVVTRDGREVTQVTLFECNDLFPVVAVIDIVLKRFTKQGEVYGSDNIDDCDLFMKPKTRIINGFEVPAPETVAPSSNSKRFLLDLTGKDLVSTFTWSGDKIDFIWLERGLVFETPGAALANAKAMLGINPYGDND